MPRLSAEPSSAPRWPLSHTLLAGVLLAIPTIIVLRWAALTWTRTALSSLGAGVMALPAALALFLIIRRQPQWPEVASGTHRAAHVVFALIWACTMSALWLHPGEGARWMLIAGVGCVLGTLVLVWGAQGSPRARAVVIPMLVALFVLPWEWALRDLDPVLQRWSAQWAAWLLDVAGYEGKVWEVFGVYTPRYWVVVNETCSGINMLITLTLFGLVFGWASQRTILGRVALQAIIPVMALGANALRIAIICLLGHYGGDALAMGPWHEGSAIIVFLPMFAVLYWVGRLLSGALGRQRGKS
ncbi:MAG: exosortase/archaeosortase family protein [Bradymonadia bacterium]